MRAKMWILGSYMHKGIDVFWRKFKPLRRCKARRRNWKESYMSYSSCTILYVSVRKKRGGLQKIDVSCRGKDSSSQYTISIT